MADKLTVTGLTKVFGSDPEAALALLREGRSKEDILRETGQTVGVSGVDFSVREAETFVVMGLSGSGKSTLVRMLNRLIEASSGDVCIDGESVTQADGETLRRIRREKIAMVFQHFALFPHRTVRENVAFGLKVQGVPPQERRERAQAALETVGLGAWGDSAPDALSGGMQQRVGLARGLAVDPQVLLMDEPFSALDPLIRGEMQEELIGLQKKLKKTIVFITHDLNEALLLGDRIAIMKDGAFNQVGTGPEIVGNPADDYVAAFTQEVDRGRVFKAETVMEPAEALDLRRDGPADARERMERLGRDALLVTENGRLAGAVRHRALAAANGGGLAAALERDVATAAPDAHLKDLYGLCAGGLPVAVVAADGRLLGAARPSTVLARLAPESDPAATGKA